MSHEIEQFEWDSVKNIAAQDFAAGVFKANEIAERANVDRRTLFRWKNHPEFKARIQDHCDEFREQTRRLGLANREQRIAALNDRWMRMRRLVEARADDPAVQGIPGGSTGLLVRDVKGLGAADKFQIVELYQVDTALLRELREHEKQAAQELGEWAEPEEPEKETPEPTKIDPTNWEPDDVRAFTELLRKYSGESKPMPASV